MKKQHFDKWNTFIPALLFLMYSVLPFVLFGVFSLSRQEAVTTGEMGVSKTKLIALTFDDGPRRSTTTALLDGLSQRGVHATFFSLAST